MWIFELVEQAQRVLGLLARPLGFLRAIVGVLATRDPDKLANQTWLLNTRHT